MLQNFSITSLVLVLIPLIVGLSIHEAAHAWSAYKLGDDTAKRLGRMTINPIPHVDPVGTLLLPAIMAMSSGFIIGWAKPVPVVFSALGTKTISRRMAIVLVAIAGPVSNVLIALVAALLSHGLGLIPTGGQQFVGALLYNFIFLNVLLAVFNMIPLPPLDGGRVAVGLLPANLAWQLARLERYGFFILIGLLFLLPMIGQSIGIRLDMLPATLQWSVQALLKPFIAISIFS